MKNERQLMHSNLLLEKKKKPAADNLINYSPKSFNNLKQLLPHMLTGEDLAKMMKQDNFRVFQKQLENLFVF